MMRLMVFSWLHGDGFCGCSMVEYFKNKSISLNGCIWRS